MIGARIRDVRNSRNLSLADVAVKAKVSVATLSRIENDKQPLDVEMLMILAKVLKVPAQELFGDPTEEAKGIDPLAKRIVALNSKDRVKLWREIASQRRSERTGRRDQAQQLGSQVEELIAQLDFLRDEVELVRSRIRRKR